MRSDYQIDKLGDGAYRVTDLRGGLHDGIDRIASVEVLQFVDQGFSTLPKVKGYGGGGSANNDFRATSDRDGTIIHSGGGNDILRGRRFNDILDGGRGSDQMYGGGGADQFRFFGNQIEGASDRDRIYDLNFGAGDTLVLGNYSPQTFHDAAGVNAYAGGSNAIISSWDGLHAAVADSDGGLVEITARVMPSVALSPENAGRRTARPSAPKNPDWRRNSAGAFCASSSSQRPTASCGCRFPESM